MMKNILIVLLVASALLPASVGYAQDSEGQNEVTTEQSEEKSGFRINISANDDESELSTDEKFERAKKAIDEIVGEEFAKELGVEIQGWDDEQKQKLISALSKDGLQFNAGDDDIPAGAVAISVIAIVFIFGMPVFIVIAVLWFGHMKRRQKIELISSYVESDQAVPAQLVNAFDPDNGEGSLRKGILLTGVGLGVFLGLGVFGESEAGGLGLIPFFMGVARLVYWYIAERTADPLSE